jgi:hypothetical protein
LLLASTAAAQLPPASVLCDRESPPILRVAGDRLHIDGKPSFPVFVSYFEVMRAAEPAIGEDFAFLKSRGFGGVRIFPQWRRPHQNPADTLLDETGRVRSDEHWQRFASVIRAAGACGLLVDVTFNRESLPNHSVEAYTRGIVEVTRRLWGSPHVLFDLQNERNHPIHAAMSLSESEVRAMRDAVKGVDRQRIVTLATDGGVPGTLALARSAGLDIVAYHESQSAGWYHQTPAIVAALKASGKPVYLQEGARAPDRGVTCDRAAHEQNPLQAALRAARDAGAAAWTFHTHAGFELARRRFQDELRACPTEWEFVEGLVSGLR